MPVLGRIWSGNPKSIELPRLNPFEPDVPDIARLVPRLVEDDRAGWRSVLSPVEQIEADAGRVPTEDGEVDAVCSCMGAKGKRRTRPNRLHFALLEETFELVELLSASRCRGHRWRMRNSHACYRSAPVAQAGVAETARNADHFARVRVFS
jgi:hypothetical protein